MKKVLNYFIFFLTETKYLLYEESNYIWIVKTGLLLGFVFCSLYIFINFELEFILSNLFFRLRLVLYA